MHNFNAGGHTVKAMLKKNRCFFVKAVIFVLILVILFNFVQNILLPKSNENFGSYGIGAFLGEPEQTLDVIAIGNSNMAQGMSMMELYKAYGYAGFTCAQPNQSISQACSLLSRILERQTPKLVILEADELFLGKSTMANAEMIVKDTLQNKFPALYYHDRWKSLTLSDLVLPVNTSWRHYARGYKLETDIAPYTGDKAYMSKNTAPVEIDRLTKACLKSFIAMCQRKNTEVMLLSIPCPKSWNKAKHDAVAAFAKAEGITYLDLNPGASTNVPGFKSSLNIDWNNDTKDMGTHLNIYGAFKVTDIFGEFLQKTRQLPDRRGAKGYEQWDQFLKEYETKIGKYRP